MCIDEVKIHVCKTGWRLQSGTAFEARPDLFSVLVVIPGNLDQYE
jgi:hypothetical protein